MKRERQARTTDICAPPRYARGVPDQGLDAEKLEVLRGWGGGLQDDARAEVAAAGRAIMLLIEEIERLHVLVWDRRLYPDVPIPRPSPDVVAADTGSPSSLHEALRERLQRGPSETFPQAEPVSAAGFHRESPSPTFLSRVRRRRSRR